eukprot:g2352.t1
MDDAVRGGVEAFMPFSFESTNRVARSFFDAEHRRVFTTPKTYLELLRLYKRLLMAKTDEAQKGIERLDGGLLKLKETGEAVAKLEADLSVAIEEAEDKAATSEAIAVRVNDEKVVVEKATEEATAEEDKCKSIALDVTQQQKATEADLAKAEPAVAAATAALNTLNKKDLSNCKTMTQPPPGVDDVFAAVITLLAGVHPAIQVQKSGRVKDADKSWTAAKKTVLQNVQGFIDTLLTFKPKIDAGEVPQGNFKDVRKYLALEHFAVETIASKNSSAGGLCAFVINIVQYYDILVTVEPKRRALAEANERLEEANTKLIEVQAHVAELNAKLDAVQRELDAANANKQAALDSVEKGKLKLNLAQRLTSALATEKVRWAANVESMRESKGLLVGDILLSAAFVSYAGPFTKAFRDQLLRDEWAPFLTKSMGSEGSGSRVPTSPACDPLGLLSTDAQIATWHTEGLPSDRVSNENGALVFSSDRWPLLIDPQLQGIAWLRANQGDMERHLHVLRLGQADLLARMEQAIEHGHSALIENIGEKVDAVLWPVVARATIQKGRRQLVKMGDKEVDFNPAFRLFLHTKLSNPVYPPEIQAECTLVNFTITRAGLEDQLLHLVVHKERPDLAKQNVTLIQQQNSYKIHILQLEDDILQRLAKAEGDITEDVELIESLEHSKSVASDIEAKSQVARDTQKSIAITSERYRAVASRGALLFFAMNALCKVHSFYMYSLNAFVVIFQRGIDVVTKSQEKTKGISRFKRAVRRVVASSRFHWNVDLLQASRMPDKPVRIDMASALVAVVGVPDGAEEDDWKHVKVLEGDELDARCDVLLDSITTVCYNYLRRGCFERDKLTVAGMITLQVLKETGAAPPEEVDALVRGGAAAEPGGMGEVAEWLSESAWAKLRKLEEVSSAFGTISAQVQVDSDDWRAWFDAPQPERAELPGDANALTALQRLLLLRALRADRLPAALTAFVCEALGPAFVAQPPFDMRATYEESSASTPILFVLFPGVDPTAQVENLAASFAISSEKGTYRNISMGQGQESPAESALTMFAKTGGWVLLQNVHLMQQWLPKLERTLEIVSASAHKSFRCFISAEPPPLPYMRNIPESLLQSCIKVANEAPSDLKSNLRSAWSHFSQDRIEQCTKPGEFKCCLFALCFFHACVLGRRKFGQQGWSRAYSFNTGDLSICADVLTSYVDANREVPWADLRYIFGEIMYGGHITDAWDRRTNNSLLHALLQPQLLSGLEIAPGFRAPKLKHDLDHQSYGAYIDTQLPAESPAMFGMHANAEIGYLVAQTEGIFGTMLLLMLGGGGDDAGAGGAASDVRDATESLLARLPKAFDMPELLQNSSSVIEGEQQPYVVVALQEARRMNVLLGEIRRTLVDLQKGMNGQLNMTDAMEDLAQAISIGQVPGRNPFHAISWEKLAWASKKSLLPWFADMQARVGQLAEWTANFVGRHLAVLPYSLWLPGMFNQMALVTAAMQVTARKRGLALDRMSTETHVTTSDDPASATAYPVDGVLVHGLFIHGARWAPREDEQPVPVEGTACAGCLCDSRLKELLPPMPLLYLKAVEVQPHWEPSNVGYLRHDPEVYDCPVYHTTFRGPTYVFLATLRAGAAPTSKWVLAGVALIMQTDD